eukprot:TRINITY_DN823_c2_g1_i1.p1 TRINITY_DN823_c2_g1~~TRINITY_DN823_c2_g1_i1.p1  ORF type:complete len:178 (-),score=30.08 TRINITY_DN823_c2_g1_i1:4-537(-)
MMQQQQQQQQTSRPQNIVPNPHFLSLSTSSDASSASSPSSPRLQSMATVNARPETLYLACIQKEHLPRCSLAFLKLLLYPDMLHFLSFTEHDNEISLIIDERNLPLFPQPETHVFAEPWNVIQIELGSCHIAAEGGLVAMVGALLAQKEIHVQYLSTFQNDFVLVQQKHFSTAGQWW